MLKLHLKLVLLFKQYKGDSEKVTIVRKKSKKQFA